MTPLPYVTTVQTYEALWNEKGADYIMEKLVEEMAEFSASILATRHNNVTFSYAVFEGMANVEIYTEILRVHLCKIPQCNGTGCLYNDVLEIKERIKREMLNSLTGDLPQEIPNCPYRKRERDMGCPCTETEPVQPCDKIKDIFTIVPAREV